MGRDEENVKNWCARNITSDTGRPLKIQKYFRAQSEGSIGGAVWKRFEQAQFPRDLPSLLESFVTTIFTGFTASCPNKKPFDRKGWR